MSCSLMTMDNIDLEDEGRKVARNIGTSIRNVTEYTPQYFAVQLVFPFLIQSINFRVDCTFTFTIFYDVGTKFVFLNII